MLQVKQPSSFIDVASILNYKKRMLQYNKYIIYRLAGPMVLICFSLTGIAWLVRSLPFIDMIVNNGVSMSTFLYISSLLIPSLLMIILPIALFISVLTVYNRMTLDSELIVLKSAGISRFSLVKPVLIFTLTITAISYLISLYLLPASYREFKDMQNYVRDNYASLLLQEGVFSSFTKELTVYSRERDDEGMLRGVLAHDTRIPSKPRTYMAEEGRLVQSPTGPRILLINGNIQEIDTSTNKPSLVSFKSYPLELKLFMKGETTVRWREPQERYISELFFPDNTPEHLLQKLKAEGHHRLTWPLYTILVALIALIPFIAGEFSRHGQSKRITVSIAIFVSFMLLGLTLSNIVARNGGLTPLLYIAILGSIPMVLYGLLNFRGFKKRSIEFS